MVMSAEYKSKFIDLSQSWWRLHMSKKILEWDKKTIKKISVSCATMLTLETFPTSNVMIVQLVKHCYYLFLQRCWLKLAQWFWWTRFLNVINVFSLFFYHIYPLGKRHDPSFEQYCIPFTKDWFGPSLVEIFTLVL